MPFRSPKKFLGDLDTTATARVVASAADVALIIDDGVIKDVAINSEELFREGYGDSWRGKKWVETVTVESRPKIEDLLNTSISAQPHWRQVNHFSAGGRDWPVKYTAVRMGSKGRLMALGRDLRSVAALQQRLVEAHQGLERDYDRMREAEARYRLLFTTISDPIVIVDAADLTISVSNPAAQRAFSRTAEDLEGTVLVDLFLKRDQRAIAAAAGEAIAAGSASLDAVKAKGVGSCGLAFSSFQSGRGASLIMRIVADGAPAAANAEFWTALERLPDGLVVADAALEIVAANRSFSEMANLSGHRQAAGKKLVNFLGRSATDFNVLVSSVRNHGFARNFATILRDQFGAEEPVEVSAVVAPSDAGELFGFSIRNVARRLEAGPRIGEELPSSVDQLTGLVGKVSLKDIVRESTDLIEKLCIEAALEITDDNRASAAEMLGLSRQGLYSKLKRFGIDD